MQSNGHSKSERKLALTKMQPHIRTEHGTEKTEKVRLPEQRDHKTEKTEKVRLPERRDHKTEKMEKVRLPE